MQHPKAILARYGLTPKKSLGQNFLFDDGLLQRIVEAAALTAADSVLEIGPGLGALTQALLRTAARVVAVELDDRLIPILQAELGQPPHLTLLHGDILACNPAELFDGPYKVIANVPYYITGAILRHLLDGPHKPVGLTLTVQAEVAERLTAQPGALSLAAVGVQFYGRTRVVGRLAAGAFWPRPNVDSAVVQIDLHREPPPVAAELFFRVARAGFGQKRKQLRNNLRPLCPDPAQLAAWLAAVGIDGARRAETLTVPEWVALAQKYAIICGQTTPKTAAESSEAW